MSSFSFPSRVGPRAVFDQFRLAVSKSHFPACASGALRVALAAFLCGGPAFAQSGPPIELEPIVVSATRTALPLDQVGSAITVITRDEMEQRQIRFVADALRTVPGLSVTRAGGIGSQTLVRIRGADEDQTLVLIDGVEVNDPSSVSGFDFANLLTDDVERIEVLRGPQSVLYGSDAVGGVINVITRKGGGPFRASAGVEGGSFGTVRGSAGLAGGLADGRIRYSLNAARLHTDGISVANERRGNSEKDGYDNLTLSASLGASLLDNLDVDVVGRFTDAEREGDGFAGGVGAIDAEEDNDTVQKFGRVQARLALLDGRWQHRVGLSGADSSIDYLTDGLKTSSFDGTKTRLDYQTDLSLSTEALLPADHTISVGVERERETAASKSAFSDFDRSITTSSVYSLYQVALFEDLFLTAGGRFDDNDRFEDATTYRLTAAYQIEETGSKLRGSYGTAVKNPTLYDLYGYDATFHPNPDLEPEKARGWDIGIDQALLGDRVLLGATYFDQRLDNFISLTGQTVVNLPGETRIRGVELTAAVALWEGLDLTASYSFTDGEDPDGNELTRNPRHQAAADLSYRFFEDRATVNLGVIRVGARDDVAFDAAWNPSIVRLDPYTLVNLAASFEVTGGFEVFGRIENLFDEEYEELFTYGTPGRAGYAGLRVRF